MKKTRKRLLALVLAGVMGFAATGCGNSQNAAATGTEETTIRQTTVQQAEETDAIDSEPETIRLYFVRHGKTILNTLNRVQGWSDSPLTEAGTNVAKDTAYGLTEIPFDLAYASDRMRAVDTAEIILEINPVSEGVDVVQLQGLRECNYGKYEGEANDVMWGDIMETLGVPDMAAMMELDEVNKKIYNAVAELDETGEAESYDEVLDRLMKSVDVIVAEAADKGAKHVLVVGHGGAIGVILNQISGQSVGELSNASVSVVDYTAGNYEMISIGDMSYCENGAAARQDITEEVKEAVVKEVKGEETGEVVIYLTRHGKTVFNTMGRTQGWVDSPLTAAGVEVAENLGKGIADVKFAAAYSSDMGRAIETAQIVLALNEAGSNVPLNLNPGLRETYYGKYEGGINMDMLNDALQELGLSSLADLSTLENGIADTTDAIHKLDETGQAENYGMMSQRVKAALDEACKETAVNGGGNILVVAHGNAIMSILNSIGDANVLEIENASVSKLTYSNGSYIIESVNDTSYAEEGAHK